MILSVPVYIFVLLLCAGLGILLLAASSRLRRYLYCPWCWRAFHIMRHYPSSWSSTICPYHARQLIMVSARRRRQARALPLAMQRTSEVTEKTKLSPDRSGIDTSRLSLARELAIRQPAPDSSKI